jgi:glycosyltransferase involved in cell wall biosynthesis
MPLRTGELPRMTFTVVIPVKNGAATLDRCLASIWHSAAQAGLDDGRVEIVVVDNGSADRSAEIAEERGCRVVYVPAADGVSASRNTGARAGRGEILVFTDSDVVFSKGAFTSLHLALSDPLLQGVVGVQDPDAAYKRYCSRFKNLWMSYSYRRLRGPVTLFYTTAAAIRRQTFLDLKGFDEQYRSPAVEDTEFGQRLGDADVRIEIRKGFLVDHRKEYSLPSLLATDFRRSAELARMLIRRRTAGTVRGGRKKRNGTSVPTAVMAGVGLGSLSIPLLITGLVASWSGAVLAGAAGLLISLLLHAGFIGHLVRRAGLVFALVSSPLILLDLLWIIAGLGWGVVSYGLAGKRY